MKPAATLSLPSRATVNTPPPEAAHAVPAIKETEVPVASANGAGVDSGKWTGVAILWVLLIAAAASFAALYRRAMRERMLAKPRRAR
jgi:hypothetical protein